MAGTLHGDLLVLNYILTAGFSVINVGSNQFGSSCF